MDEPYRVSILFALVLSLLGVGCGDRIDVIALPSQLRVLGEGCSATVYAYEHDGAEFAVKVFSSYCTAKMEVEMQVLNALREHHPHSLDLFALDSPLFENPVQVYQENWRNPKRGIVFPIYHSNLDAFWIADLEDAELLAFSVQIAKALSALHEAGFLHSDLGLDNVLVRESEDGFTVALSDFGSALRLESFSGEVPLVLEYELYGFCTNILRSLFFSRRIRGLHFGVEARDGLIHRCLYSCPMPTSYEILQDLEAILRATTQMESSFLIRVLDKVDSLGFCAFMSSFFACLQIKDA
jgi:serine/threonine protein kinase